MCGTFRSIPSCGSAMRNSDIHGRLGAGSRREKPSPPVAVGGALVGNGNVKRNVETRKGDISVDDAGSRARTEIVLINATGPGGGLGRCGLR